MDTILRATRLKKEYIQGSNKILAVRDVSITLKKGEMTAITGPSGCGKTTLINMIGLLVKPSEGNIIIEKKHAETLSVKELAYYRNKMFGYVVQDFALVEDYTVYENIEIPLVYSSNKLSKAKRKEKIKMILGQVGLSIKIDEKVSNLSGGQRQRVAIARAIINDPQIILADEPTGSLDSATSSEIIFLLETLVDKGKTLLLVTHDDKVATRCQEQIKMRDGLILQNNNGSI